MAEKIAPGTAALTWWDLAVVGIAARFSSIETLGSTLFLIDRQAGIGTLGILGNATKT
jgi:hypothetical protein